MVDYEMRHGRWVDGEMNERKYKYRDKKR